MSDPKILTVGDIHHAPPEADLRLDHLCERPGLSGQDLHDHLFAAGGDVQVIKALAEIWPAGAIGIGFSAAGTLLWRAALAGVPLGGLICVSATRLRLQTQAPDLPRLLIWSASDPGVPRPEWQARTLSESLTVAGTDVDAGHDFYAHLTVAERGKVLRQWLEILQRQTGEQPQISAS